MKVTREQMASAILASAASVTPDDLRTAADRCRPRDDDYITALRLGEIRSRLRCLADLIEAST